MRRHLPILTGAFMFVAGLFSVFHTNLEAADAAGARRVFAKPGREHASAPLWTWNDQLTEEQVRSTLRDLAGQRVRQVFVHPRPGLMTPYLSGDWFRLWKVALDEATKLDMNVWIYDENSYPSGFAGGWVPELMPEARGRGLELKEGKQAPKWSDALLGVYRLEGQGMENVTAKVKQGEALPEGRYVTATQLRAKNSGWYGGRCYVDLLYPGVTEKFIEVTHEAYRREVGHQFGKRIPGIFTDEPELTPAGGLPWTADLPEQFLKRWGYSLLENLPSLTFEAGDWKKVRHNYYQTLLDLFIERWGKPYYDYCAKHGLEFTGHYWEHGWPGAQIVPDNMALAAWQQRPGVDILMNQYAEHTHAQFGNVRACREVSSLANQLGRARTLVELYGAGGWDLRFEDMKRMGDWVQVLGVNTIDEHVSYVTIRGARKRDHPQSFSYHEPWWNDYHVVADYFSRVTAALTQGEQVNQVLVLEPTTSAWCFQHNPKVHELGDTFFKLLLDLEAAQVEYDLGCEDVMAREGSVVDGKLRIGRRDYRLVVLPPLLKNLNRPTVQLLEAYARSGGKVLVAEGAKPTRMDGHSQEGMLAWPNCVAYAAGGAAAAVRAAAPDVGFALRRAEGDRGILFHHRRQLKDGELLFLVNTSIEHPSSGVVESVLSGVEQWDPFTGRTAGYAFERSGGGVTARFELPPSGSLLLFLSKKSLKPKPAPAGPPAVLAAAGETVVRRLGPNVLTLDFVDLAIGNERWTNLYFNKAGNLAFQKNGMDVNPWDHAVQFKDELIRKTFPAGSGFEASYRFVLEGAVPANLEIVLERPDLYTITCNGQPVQATPGAWWLDKAFGRLPLAAAARPGMNVVTIKASPFTVFHEIEPAYVLGDFTLRAVEKGFVLVTDQPLRLGLGSWKEQGHPFYAQGVAYARKYHLGKKGGDLVVALPSWLGSVARVKVNGKLAGHIVSAPWQCHVTKLVKPGENTVEVEVVGTLKNTLGPHHGNPKLGAAWPAAFRIGPETGLPAGASYSLVDYGLFQPFELRQQPGSGE